MSYFDKTSQSYATTSTVQKNAAGKLIKLMDMKGKGSVLDVACGPGHITNEIFSMTKGRVVGTDVSEKMIEKAMSSYKGIEFRVLAAEDLDYNEEFNYVFCNSSFQWFRKPETALKGMCRALKTDGLVAIACPATNDFAPFFFKAISKACEDSVVREGFKKWRSPWFYLPDEKAYEKLFTKCGFKTISLDIKRENDVFTVQKAYEVYLSGAAVGFAGKEFYEGGVSDAFIERFNAEVKRGMQELSVNGKVKFTFNRLYYVGMKVKGEK